MKSIHSYYHQEISRLLLKKFLLGGQVPPPQALEAAYVEFLEQYPELGQRSLLAQQGDLISPRDEVTLEQWQLFVIFSKLDARVLRSILIDAYETVVEVIASWQVFYRNTAKHLTNLNDRLTERVLLNTESAGYFDSYTEDFISLETADEERTTAEIQPEVGILKMSENNTRFYNHKLSNVGLDASFAATIDSSSGSTFMTVTGTSLANIIAENERGWIVSGFSRTPGTATCTLTVRLKETTGINKIIYRRLRGDLSRGSVRAFYTSDRISWSEFGSSTALSGTNVFIGPKVDMKEIRFVLTKLDYDSHLPDTGYQYSFDCQEVQLFEDVAAYETENGNVFYSNAISLRPFNKCVMTACDVNTDSTFVRYEVGVDGTNYFPINPLGNEPSSVPHIVRFSSNEEKTSNDFVTTSDHSIETSSEVGVILTGEQSFLLPSEETALINFLIPGSEVIDSQILVNSLTVLEDWAETPSVDHARGWNTDALWSTTVYFSGYEPREVDFGPLPITINGETSVGTYLFKIKGWYTISAPPSRYSFTEGVATNLEELRIEDPLYPYNLKHLVEGYPYSESFEGPRIYTGFEKRAAQKLKRAVGLDEFLSNLRTTFYQSINNNGDMVFLVKRPVDVTRIGQEKYLVGYNATDSTFSELYVRISLSTGDTSISPLVSNYTVKVGQ